VIGGQNHQRRKDAMRGYIVAAMNMCFDGQGRHLSAAFVLYQADADLFDSEQKCHNFDWVGPLRLVPGMVRYENSVAAHGRNRFRSAGACNLHAIASGNGNGKPRKVCDIGERWRGCASVTEMNTANTYFVQISLQFVNDLLIWTLQPAIVMSEGRSHGRLH